jgi:hypothetical protein
MRLVGCKQLVSVVGVRIEVLAMGGSFKSTVLESQNNSSSQLSSVVSANRDEEREVATDAGAEVEEARCIGRDVARVEEIEVAILFNVKVRMLNLRCMVGSEGCSEVKIEAWVESLDTNCCR